MKKRLYKVVYTILVFMSIGLGYAYFISKTGIYIPCLFRLVTGFKCPGCGVSHYCMNILNFIFKGFNIEYLKLAYLSNSFIFIIAPIIFVLIVYYLYKWVRYNEKKESKVEKIGIGILCSLAIIWGIVRNILGI